MSRYEADAGIEGEYEPGSGGRVLRNLRGIRRIGEMHQTEFDALTRAKLRYQDIVQETTRFDMPLLCAMHRDWLWKIYAWAGQYRKFEMAKGGFRWPPAHLVAQNMIAFDSGFLRECTPCRPAAVGIVAERVAKVHAELLLIHPFREGNGRMARWLADLMIQQADLPTPDYGFEGKGSRKRQQSYLNAVIRGYAQDYRPLTEFFIDVIERRLAEDL